MEKSLGRKKMSEFEIQKDLRDADPGRGVDVGVGRSVPDFARIVRLRLKSLMAYGAGSQD